MNELRCTTCNCEHNINCHCNAGIIDIGQNAACKTKQKREYGLLEQEKVNMEAGKDWDYNDCDNVVIHCDCTDCKHNKNCSCGCQNVTISDGVVKTKCMSRVVRK